MNLANFVDPHFKADFLSENNLALVKEEIIVDVGVVNIMDYRKQLPSHAEVLNRAGRSLRKKVIRINAQSHLEKSQNLIKKQRVGNAN